MVSGWGIDGRSGLRSASDPPIIARVGVRRSESGGRVVQSVKILRPLCVLVVVLATSGPAAYADEPSAYATRCAGCHGADGRADTPVGRALGIASFEGRTFTLEGVTRLLRESQSHASVDRTSIDEVLPAIVETLNTLGEASD